MAAIAMINTASCFSSLTSSLRTKKLLLDALLLVMDVSFTPAGRICGVDATLRAAELEVVTVDVAR